MAEIVIRPVEAADWPRWLVLWEGYAQGMAGADVTAAAWRRFLDPAEPHRALVPEGDGRLNGFAHLVLHPVTSRVEPACFLQDLFVRPEARGRGLGRRLLEAACAAAREEGCREAYGRVRSANAAALRLCDRIAGRTDFVLCRTEL